MSLSPALTRAEPYRWLIADRVPFSRSIEVKIENSYSAAGAEWTSVAFWYQLAPAPGDLDGDFDVDADDLEQFETCATGPGIGPPPAYCRKADFDGDADIDQADFGVLQRCYGGANRLSDPACAE